MTKPLLHLLNGNSNEALTRRLAGLADVRIAGKVILEAETVAASPRQIVTRRDVARSAVHILDHVEARFADEKRARPDAVVLACFGEPGLGALREAVDVPVFGLLESSARLAASLGSFSILTPGAAWPAQLRELLAVYGLTGQCHGISVYSESSLSDDPLV
ncbi:MAG: aspartate/glutamate racemase family protein, partial [Oricola sp.]